MLRGSSTAPALRDSPIVNTGIRTH